MFSRLYTNARNIITRTPSNQKGPTASDTEQRESPIDTTEELVAGMVTTRRGTATESPDVDFSKAKHPSKREREEATYAVSSKRIKRTASETLSHNGNDVGNDDGNEVETVEMEAQEQEQHHDADEEISSLDSVTAGDGETTPKPKGKLPLRNREHASQKGRSSPIVLIETKSRAKSDYPLLHEASTDDQPSATQESTYETPLTHHTTSVYTTPATHTRKEASTTPQLEAASPMESEEQKCNKKQKQKEKTAENSFDTHGSLTPKPSTTEVKRKHLRFDSEEPLPKADTAPEPEIPSSTLDPDEQISSDDDEAPETVTRASAIQQTKLAEAEAAKVVKEQNAAAKLKRQEHDARRAEEKRRNQKQHGKKKHRDTSQLTEDLAPEISLQNLPTILPESLLSSIPNQRPATPPPALSDTLMLDRKQQKWNRHIKFLEQGEKRIKDVKRGPINVRVLEKNNTLLAPKASLRSRSIREAWLKGRFAKKAAGKGKSRFEDSKMERKVVGGGFLRR
ncbi:hypothetical protein K432DRAFT_379404 [Lepidopterella palustris CBS 459.81]|uniref:Uncharacterized protein n=1 Tax=Lepidopterella palustris CBS 459.81 TaxID=1314670 RepID=A0A8E2EGD6_9PEZI|nr:hypothetical protein K432DRAFT_379404 [Lepidopterella palustris CBS 459.81]